MHEFGVLRKPLKLGWSESTGAFEKVSEYGSQLIRICINSASVSQACAPFGGVKQSGVSVFSLPLRQGLEFLLSLETLVRPGGLAIRHGRIPERQTCCCQHRLTSGCCINSFCNLFRLFPFTVCKTYSGLCAHDQRDCLFA